MSAQAIAQLDHELAELRKFVNLLTEEQQALLNNEADRLLDLSASKSQAASLLSDIACTRRKSLLSGPNDSMEAWMGKHAPDKMPLWTEIRKLASEAQHLNTTNGELIQARLRNNQQTMNVLFKSSQNTAGIYGPDGQTNINNAGRHLGTG